MHACCKLRQIAAPMLRLLELALALPLLPSTLRPRCAAPRLGVKGPPPIASRYFSPLDTPADFNSLISSVPNNSVSVIKFQAPWCRTCRASAPLLDRTAKKWPDASYYSMELVRNGKAAGERMNRFFKSKNITQVRPVPAPPAPRAPSRERARPRRHRCRTSRSTWAPSSSRRRWCRPPASSS